LGPRIRNQRHRSDGGKVGGAGRPEQGEGVAAAMASAGKVAGVGGVGALGHGFPIREHLEEEEDEASSFQASMWLGRGPSGLLHGRRPWSLPKFAARA